MPTITSTRARRAAPILDPRADRVHRDEEGDVADVDLGDAQRHPGEERDRDDDEDDDRHRRRKAIGTVSATAYTSAHENGADSVP
jgi:hypothetical protein